MLPGHFRSKKLPMFNLKQRFTGPNSAVAILIAAAIGALLFMVVAGAVVYDNTQRLISAGKWVEHTQEVLIVLQRTSLLNERVEYRTRLYLATGDEDQLNRAESAANQLEIAVVQLKALVADNLHYVEPLNSLTACTAELTRTVTALDSKSPLPEALIRHCQQSISLMNQHEQVLLKDRTSGSQRTSITSVATEFAFVALSLLILIVLFGFLLRDAVLRQRVGKLTLQTNQNLAESVAALEDRAHESELLTSSRDELQLCIEVGQVYLSAAKSFERLLPGTSGSLCMINNSRQMVEVVSSWGDITVEDFSPPESCCGLRSGRARWRQPGISEIHCTHFVENTPERYLCIPVVAHGNTLGILYVECESDEAVLAVNSHMDGLRQLLQLTGMAVASLNLRAKLENQSIRDGLTGLFNRNFMEICLDRELSRASRKNQTLAVFMLDLDHFKRFNDTYGHAAGDTALKAIAEIFRASVRTEDIACRYGGEEFTIILPDVTASAAFAHADNVRRAVTNLRIPLDKEVYGEFTVSIGVAMFPNDGDEADLLLRRADQALYRAKRAGRNQVALFDNVAVIS
jgi:diguanylate cyclase (GGDEF)-like protein